MIANLLNSGKAPTVSNIVSALGRYAVDMRYVHHYLGRGGTVEHALNCVIDATKTCEANGDCGWEWEIFRDKIENSPETPLDFDWDFARYSLMEMANVGSQLGIGSELFRAVLSLPQCFL